MVSEGSGTLLIIFRTLPTVFAIKDQNQNAFFYWETKWVRIKLEYTESIEVSYVWFDCLFVPSVTFCIVFFFIVKGSFFDKFAFLLPCLVNTAIMVVAIVLLHVFLPKRFGKRYKYTYTPHIHPSLTFLTLLLWILVRFKKRRSTNLQCMHQYISTHIIHTFHTYIFICIYIHMYRRTYIHTYIHSYIHTYP